MAKRIQHLDSTSFNVVEVIYQTQERLFHQDMQTRSRVFLANFFSQPGEILFEVFILTVSQTLHISWKNARQKFAKPDPKPVRVWIGLGLGLGLVFLVFCL